MLVVSKKNIKPCEKQRLWNYCRTFLKQLWLHEAWDLDTSSPLTMQLLIASTLFYKQMYFFWWLISCLSFSMTFTISALETEDHECQGVSLCSSESQWEWHMLSHSLPTTDTLMAASGCRQIWEDSSASTPSRWHVPFPVVNMAFFGLGRFLINSTNDLLMLQNHEIW